MQDHNNLSHNVSQNKKLLALTLRQLFSYEKSLKNGLHRINSSKTYILRDKLLRKNYSVLTTVGTVMKSPRIIKKTVRVLLKYGPLTTFSVIRRYLITHSIYSTRDEQIVRNSNKINLYEPFVENNSQFSVLYIIGLPEGESKRYRVFNFCETLKQNHLDSTWIYAHELDDLHKIQYALNYDLLVFFRVGYSQTIHDFIALAKARGKITIFDFDDYVFNEEIVPFIDEIKHWPKQKFQNYVDGVKLYEKALMDADYFTGTTEYMVNKAKSLYGITGYTIENFINHSQIKQVKSIEKIYLEKSRNSSEVVILFVSGTTTHKADFNIVVKPLRYILNKYPQVKLKIIGHFEVPSSLSQFSSQIIKKPFMKEEDLIIERFLSDINIIPLEVNSFTHGKSELKYFETALARLPSIASPIHQYKFSIKNGVNGFIAKDAHDWQVALEKLVTQTELRKTMGQRAYKHATSYYYPDSMGKKIVQTYTAIIDDYRHRLGLKDNGLKIHFYCTKPIPGSGGHNSIFRISKYLGRCGHKCQLRFLNVNENEIGQVKLIIDKYFGKVNATIESADSPPAKSDIAIATHWTTANIVKELTNAQSKCYFIQDYEPYFYPMSYEYLSSRETYLFPDFNHICFSSWMSKTIEAISGKPNELLHFPVNRKIYFDQKVKRDSNHILFLARPDMPRRCFDYGLEVLENVYMIDKTIKISLFGSNVKPYYHRINFRFHDLGVLPTNQLANIYNKATLGIVFSTTNPSLMPFEMGSCGLPVIDLDDSDLDLKFGSKGNILNINRDPHDSAKKIVKWLADDKLRNAVVSKFSKYIQKLPSEEEHAREFERILIKINKQENLRETISLPSMQTPI